jgi:hypothetical protein
MLAEIFLLRIEAIVRATGTNQPITSSEARFVPITQPKPGPKPSDKRS